MAKARVKVMSYFDWHSRIDVSIDGFDVGGTIALDALGAPEPRTEREARVSADPARYAREIFPAQGVEADARWILEQIPGCADLEIEWVKR